MKIPEQFRMIDNRRINEYHLRVKLGDTFVLINGAINAGVGELLNFRWNWDSVAKYAQREYKDNIGHASGRRDQPGMRRSLPVPARG